MEGFHFFDGLVRTGSLRAPLKFMKKVTLGCDNYKSLICSEIPEFKKLSIVILDGDSRNKRYNKKLVTNPTLVYLPTEISPEQVVFEYLYNLDPGDNFWKNEISFTRAYFDKLYLKFPDQFREKVSVYSYGDLDLKKVLEECKADDHFDTSNLRNYFKDFLNDEGFKILMKKVNTNPFHSWAKNTEDGIQLSKIFETEFKASLKCALANNGCPQEKIVEYI